MKYYDQSKSASVLFGLELDRRLRAAGSPVRSLLAHPGITATNLQHTGPAGLFRVGGAHVNRLFAQDVEIGRFFGPDGWKELRGHPTVVRPDPAAEALTPNAACGCCPRS